MKFVIAVALPLAVSGIAAADSPPPAARPAPVAPPRSEAAEAATYDRCLKLAKEHPAEARKLAESWQARGGAHPADHCLAVALIGLKQYREGAGRLETLAKAMVHAPAALRADVLDQAAQAWLLAGDPARAYAAEGSALALHPGDPELLVDRAEAAGSAGWFERAIADLDQVLKAAPTRLDALIYRAAAYRALGRLDPALADIDAALKAAPDSLPALLERGNILVLRDDLDGARRDWQRVTQLAHGGADAAAAKANLARLDAIAAGAARAKSPAAAQQGAPQGPAPAPR